MQEENAILRRICAANNDIDLSFWENWLWLEIS